jgi:predicted secreted Zn-dependent protease
MTSAVLLRNTIATLLAACSGASWTSARGEVVLVEQRQSHTIDAVQPMAFRRQLARYLDQRSPGAGSRTHGLTRADLEVRYVLSPLPGGDCSIDAVRVTLALQLDALEWQPAGPPDDGMRQGAGATVRGLQLHGWRHRANALRAATRIDAALRAVPPMSCAEARRHAARIARQGRARLRADDIAHDSSSEFLDGARATLGLASGSTEAPRAPDSRRSKREGRRVSAAQLSFFGR